MYWSDSLYRQSEAVHPSETVYKSETVFKVKQFIKMKHFIKVKPFSCLYQNETVHRNILPGQSPASQSSNSNEAPTQSFPLAVSAGKSHVLDLVMLPMPQEAEQELQDVHTDHSPSAR